MERKEFLRSLGAGAAFAVIFPCVQGCSKDDDPWRSKAGAHQC